MTFSWYPRLATRGMDATCEAATAGRAIALARIGRANEVEAMAEAARTVDRILANDMKDVLMICSSVCCDRSSLFGSDIGLSKE